MNKLSIIFLLISMSQANDCSEFASHFSESIEDIKMAIELQSKDEATYFLEEAYEDILDFSAVCTKQSHRDKIRVFKKTLYEHRDLLNGM